MSARLEAFLSYGFRPFFLMAGLYAVIAMVPWIAQFTGISVVGPHTNAALVDWHAHEMLFGYTAAAIAGFFLTAVPSWTDTKPVSGGALALLASLWLAGRIVNWGAAILPPMSVAIIDAAFFPLLMALVMRALITGWSKRNFIFLPLFAGFFAANVLFHLHRLGFDANLDVNFTTMSHRLALDLAIMLIIILGGRVTPAFTTNTLRNRGESILPHQSDNLTRAALISIIGFVISDLIAPTSILTGAFAATAAAVTFVRLAGWRAHRVLDTPILWVLFMGYGFVALGLAASALSILSDTIPRSAADHLLTIGGIGAMTLGIMTRAALGHTGRTPHASRPMITAFVLIGLATLIRTAAPLISSEHYTIAISLAGGMWLIAFVIFSLSFWPVLTRPRLRRE